MVSIHALLAECDSANLFPVLWGRCFNPRTPCGVRQEIEPDDDYVHLFQSTHSLRSATCVKACGPTPPMVSIHALLAECDLLLFSIVVQVCCFNPRTPCGVRPEAACTKTSSISFNPRTPCGVRRLWSQTKLWAWLEFQSTHSLRSATKKDSFSLAISKKVSIHALLAECD